MFQNDNTVLLAFYDDLQEKIAADFDSLSKYVVNHKKISFNVAKCCPL